MGMGFSGGSLAVFTALAPAGAVAFATVAAFLLAHRDMPCGLRDRMNHAQAVPLAVAWAGFIASATHLGTPANALHAVTGIGRSPLSNEVVAVVAFLFVAGVYWLYTFKVSYARRLADALGVLSILACIAMVAMMAFAYSVPTVPSWDTWHAPANLCVSALVGGLSLGAAMLREAPEAQRWRTVLLRALPGAIVAMGVMMAWYAAFLGGVSNNVAQAAEGVSSYGTFVAAFAALSLAGWFLQARSSRALGWKRRVLDACGCALVMLALLLARIPFYEAYLSVGF